MNYDLKHAAESDLFKFYAVSFINEPTGALTEFGFMGIGLANVEYSEAGSDCREFILLLDNGQFCHVFHDRKGDTGRYRVADTLDDLGPMYVALKEVALDSLSYKLRSLSPPDRKTHPLVSDEYASNAKEILQYRAELAAQEEARKKAAQELPQEDASTTSPEIYHPRTMAERAEDGTDDGINNELLEELLTKGLAKEAARKASEEGSEG